MIYDQAQYLYLEMPCQYRNGSVHLRKLYPLVKSISSSAFTKHSNDLTWEGLTLVIVQWAMIDMISVHLRVRDSASKVIQKRVPAQIKRREQSSEEEQAIRKTAHDGDNRTLLN